MTVEQRHRAFTSDFYQRAPTIARSAARSGHGDAAHLCDCIAKDIEVEHTGRGRVTKHGQALAAAVRRAADAIWAMREELVP